MKILLVDDEEAIRDIMSRMLENLGHTPVVASDGLEGLRKFEEEKPDMVLTDILMPGIDGLELLAEIRKRDFRTFVVILTGCESWENVTRAMELKANNYLKKPVEFQQIKRLLERYSSLVRDFNIEKNMETRISRKRIEFTVESSPDIVPELVEYLVRMVRDRLPEEKQFGLRLGLSELITNAIEHGNFGISFEKKSKALEKGPEALHRLFKEKMCDPEIAGRKVKILFSESPEGYEWVITDEGSGFDWRPYMNAPAFEDLEMNHGRGIFLSRFQFDLMEYLDSGRTVRLFIKK